MAKKLLGIDVLTAARQRIAWAFDRFRRLYVSFSGGKDSTVMLHLVMDEARRREQRVGVLFVDLEAQYRLTIDHVQECYDLYADLIDPYWVALPVRLRNAVSQFEPRWTCWDSGREADWVRRPPGVAITDVARWSWFQPGMEFEEFVPRFGIDYGASEPCCCFVGIRTRESLNRWRTIAAGRKQACDGQKWTTLVDKNLWNAYPIYDWRAEDIWTYHGKTGLPYNRLYDRMHQAGLTLHQMRICQPYGDDQRKGLWLFHLIEPETWARVVARVNGANQGALYAQETGNILGRIKIDKPAGHTWRSFAEMLLESMPAKSAEHYQIKVNSFIAWWLNRGYLQIPDEAPHELEASKKAPSWRRICKAILRNDYWCKGLSFAQTDSHAYQRYIAWKRRKQAEERAKWDRLEQESLTRRKRSRA